MKLEHEKRSNVQAHQVRQQIGRISTLLVDPSFVADHLAHGCSGALLLQTAEHRFKGTRTCAAFEKDLERPRAANGIKEIPSAQQIVKCSYWKIGKEAGYGPEVILPRFAQHYFLEQGKACLIEARPR